MLAPRNFIEELHRELADSSHELAWQAERLSSLAELQRIAVAVTLRIGRPATVLDVLDSAHDEAERRRLERLTHSVRSGQGLPNPTQAR